MVRRRHRRSWWGRHSLTVVALVLLSFWLAGYVWLDPQSHLGAFCGNAIADWSGSLVIILGTKFFYEIGSAESKPVRGRVPNPVLEFLLNIRCFCSSSLPEPVGRSCFSG